MDSQESSPTPQFQSINSSAFFMVQLSHPYMTNGKTITLTIWAFFGKVVSLLFNTQSNFVMGFPGGSEVKVSACNAETWVQSLGWEDPLEKEMATHSSILA